MIHIMEEHSQSISCQRRVNNYLSWLFIKGLLDVGVCSWCFLCKERLASVSDLSIYQQVAAADPVSTVWAGGSKYVLIRVIL